MEGPPLGPGGKDITWPDQVAPRGRKASSTRKIKPQTPNLFRLSRKDLLTGVSKKVRINCRLKVGASSTGIPEIIFVIQLLERIIESFHTWFFVQKTLNLRRDLKFFLPCALKIYFDVDRIGEEGDEADPLDDG